MSALQLMLTLTTAPCILAGCSDGFYGRDCTYNCGKGCLNYRCTTSEYGTGNCTDGCLNGYSGVSCSFDCPPFCIKCKRDNDSLCTQCHKFHYGLSCENSCRKLCHAGCDMSGTCLSKDTKIICGHHCNDCNIQLGKCKLCEAGFYGEKCDKDCNKNCDCGRNDNDTVKHCGFQCEQHTGNCSHGCVKSHFGNKCQHRCNEHCKNSMCNQLSGQCVKGCSDGYYGLECTMQCSKHCEHNVCERETGDCTNGCSDGYYGQKCQQKCGAGCEVCNRHSGECIITGTTIETGRNITYPPDTSVPYLYFIVGGVAGFVVLTIVSAICSNRFCLSKGNGSTVIPEKDETPKHIPEPEEPYTEINAYSEIYKDVANKRRPLSTRRTRSFSYHPVTEGLLPSAPTCYGFKQASTLGSRDQWRRSENICRSPSVVTNRDTDDVVLELKLLTSQGDYMKVCDKSDCRHVSPNVSCTDFLDHSITL